jgi:hypothetical protein
VPTDHHTGDNHDPIDAYAAELVEFWQLRPPPPGGSTQQRAA